MQKKRGLKSASGMQFRFEFLDVCVLCDSISRVLHVYKVFLYTQISKVYTFVTNLNTYLFVFIF